MGPRLPHVVLLALTLTPVAAWARGPALAPAAEARIESVAAGVRVLALDPAPEAGKRLAEQVQRGLPPAVLAVLLDVLGAHPRGDLTPIVVRLTRDRRPEIRARAIVAWAALGERFAMQAIAAAADDIDARIRVLAWVLAQRHPSPSSDAVVQALAARDAEIAARVDADRRLASAEALSSGEADR